MLGNFLVPNPSTYSSSYHADADRMTDIRTDKPQVSHNPLRCTQSSTNDSSVTAMSDVPGDSSKYNKAGVKHASHVHAN